MKKLKAISHILILILMSANLFATQPMTQAANKIYNSHAIAMHGEPKYSSNFKHFDYTNPQAPKTGTLKLAVQGTFDSLNPFIAKGNAAGQIGLIYETLTIQSSDEPFTEYGLIAKSIKWPEDRTWVEYTLRSEAKFHDGKPITAEDVKFTFDILLKEGNPAYRGMYADVTEVKIISPLSIKFSFKNDQNRELIMLVGQLPVLPKHYWKNRDFSKSSLEIPLGSGPYKVKAIDAGKNIVFELVEPYWGSKLAANKGKDNFHQVRYDYYRDSTVLLEALKSGEYDFRLENVSKLWATGYSGTAITKGWLKKEYIKHENPTGMQAFVMNLRNPLFQDIRVRKALNYAFDFEWTNHKLFFDAYKRNESYFSNSELASTGLPTADELKLLEPLKHLLPNSVFTEPFALPKTDGKGNNRQQLLISKKLLEEAGWKVKDNILQNSKGQPFAFEFLVYDASFERIINPYIKSLAKLGIQANIKRVETSQFIDQIRTFNYDMIVDSFSQSLSPGAELVQYWHSSTADTPASLNTAGIKNKAIDQLIETVMKSVLREDLVTATKALDRAMLHNWFVIPQWHIDSHRIAYWDKFSRPDISPKYDTSFNATLFTWWIDEKKLKVPPKK